MMDEDKKAEGEPDIQPRSALVRRALGKTAAVFDRLGAYSYLSALDRHGFAYYRELYEDALLRIDRRIIHGKLEPVDLRDFPQVVRFPRYDIRAALFIGSFDPFQMTHLAMALRYLASDSARAPVVFVVPEGYDNPQKPAKSDYTYRCELLGMQTLGVFDPLIAPLDIGEGADTIEIVRRFIRLFPGASMHLTHILGSDALPYAARLLPQDMAAWKEEAALRNVGFSYDAFVVKREGAPDISSHVQSIREQGHEVVVDEREILTPSSTDFREHHAFSIVFPTESVIRHMEVLFRYNLNRPWGVCGLDDTKERGITQDKPAPGWSGSCE